MSLASANERERRGAARLTGDRGARASIGQESAQARDRRLQGRAGQESRPDFHVPAYQDGRRITGWIVKAYISGSSGVVTQFVAAIFFYLYNRTVQQGARSDQATANKRRSQGRAILF